VVDDSNKRPEHTVFAFLLEDDGASFDAFQIKSLIKVGVMIESNGGKYCKSLSEVVDFLNS